MQTKNKSSLFAALIAVLISVTLVAVAVYAVTTVGNDVSVGGTLGVTGAATLSSTLNVTGTSTLATTTATKLTVSGATALDGGLTMDTNKFTVADGTGNTLIAGTLDVTGTSTLATTTVNGSLSISEGALADSTVVSADIKDSTIATGDLADDAVKQAKLDYEVVTVDIVPAANSGTTTVTSGAEILGYYPTTNDGKVVDSISISATTLTLTVNTTSTATSTFKIPLLKP